MIIFLYGADSYRSGQKLNEIVNHYKKSQKSGLNLIYIDAMQADFSDFYNTIRVSAIFSEKKLIVLKNVFSNKKFQEDLLETVKDVENLKDVIVIHEQDMVDERLKLFKVLIKSCKSQEFSVLDTRNIKIWAQKEFEKRKQKINVDALDLLLSYIGSDLWRFANEINKLTDFKKDSVIKKEDVELQVKPKIEVDIFKTIDAIALKNKSLALSLLQKHLDNGDEPLYLLSMVAYQFRNLLVVKELAQKGLMYNSIVQKSGLHPYVVKKNYFTCQQFSMEELKRIYYAIFQIDTNIKKGKIEPETALDLLISKI